MSGVLHIALALLLVVASSATAQDDGAEPFEPPLSGQPTRFNGAVGIFRVSTEAEAKAVQVDKPLRLTLRVTASGKVLVAPVRPDLAADPLFAERFRVEPAEPPGKQTKDAWEFCYLLKPRSAGVKEVPEVAFCFFDPSFGPDPRGYQTSYSEAIPLTVTPAPTELPNVKGDEPAALPEHLLQIVRGEDVLRRDRPWQLPAAPVLVLLLLAPPAGCAAWYIVWCHFRPDSARQVHRRRSRAGRRALKALDGRHTREAEQIADTLGRYLQERFGLSSVTPTPVEVRVVLQQAGAPQRLSEFGYALFAACDAACYAQVCEGSGLRDQATAFILAVEAEPWSSSS